MILAVSIKLNTFDFGHLILSYLHSPLKDTCRISVFDFMLENQELRGH